jgi:hypothetical protein
MNSPQPDRGDRSCIELTGHLMPPSVGSIMRKMKNNEAPDLRQLNKIKKEMALPRVVGSLRTKA